MASITTDPGGSRRVQFVDARGKRRTVRLGKVNQKAAEAVRTEVEAILADLIIGRPHDDEVSRWLRDRDPRLRKRLEAAGLCGTSGRREATIKELVAEFLSALTGKAGTRRTYGQTTDRLVEFFGEGRLVRTVDPLDADRFRQWLKSESAKLAKVKEKGLAEATTSKRVKTARQVFKQAVRWRMTEAHPFAEVVAGSQKNKARMSFVDVETIRKVIDQAPDAEWKLIIALSRFGGLRCPSEVLLLRWEDIDWEAGKLFIRSPKTEKNEGGESRFAPLFHELRPYLLDCFEQAEPGAVYCITRYRDAGTNLRTSLERYIRRAGVQQWPRLYHNLRSSRQTELSERYPAHVVCAWLGNSEAVARDHYLQTLGHHFTAASAEPAEQAAWSTGAKTVQHPPAPAGTGRKSAASKSENPPVFRGMLRPACRCRAT